MAKQRHRSERLTFSLDKETRSAIEAAAEREKRSIASVVYVICCRWALEASNDRPRAAA